MYENAKKNVKSVLTGPFQGINDYFFAPRSPDYRLKSWYKHAYLLYKFS